MVSFQCEGCGDVLTKKKLDAHRGKCSNASYTCLDCMTHFQGSAYKSHTSCISEDQKYQGALYQEKPKKSVKIVETNGHGPKAAYVEDAPDQDVENAISIISAPPEAPIPPPAAPQNPAVNVFDFLVNEDTPNASKISLAPPGESIMDYTPSILGSEIGRKPKFAEDDPDYDKKGYSYGKTPIPATHKKEKAQIEYITPAAKGLREKLEKSYVKTSSADKKRKRNVEDLDLTVARATSHDSDAIMEDAAPPSLHSGLTGGLNRLLSRSSYSPSLEHNEPLSPVHRSKSRSSKVRDRDDSKHRSVTSSTAGALVKVGTRRASDESRPRKKKRHRSQAHADEGGSHHRRRHRTKAIEHSSAAAADSQQQLVVYKSRAEFFMSLINKGEESERGLSVHKVLKRYHRERARDREDEEKELFKSLRVRKNEKGEVVVFF